MELKILSPQENGFIQEIKWNNEELKTEIAAKMEEYKGLVFTEETIKDARKDRANLNKLKNAFEDERKRIKKLCMEPYNQFEQQVKEVTRLIDEPICLIDSQIKEVEQAKKEEKRKRIEELFRTIGFQSFVSLDNIWDEKWLNATVSLTKIEEQMKTTMYRIGNDVATIHRLPEFSFEAMDMYKKTLDLSQAIKEGQRLADIQKRKAEHEAEQERQRMEEAERQKKIAVAKAEELPKEPNSPVEEHPMSTSNTDAVQAQPDELMYLDFRVWGTREQLLSLRDYMKKNNLKFGKVE